MNKRQAKKQRNKDILGICHSYTYRDNRKITRDWQEYITVSNRYLRHCCINNIIPEDVKELIEIGVYTDEEFTSTNVKKPKERTRQIMKCKGRK